MRTLEPEAGPLGPKKTVLVIATVVGCIGILWPKIFHPMLIGGGGSSNTETPLPPGLLKDRGPGCCGVVLNSDLQQYMNSTLGDGKRFRGSLSFLLKDQSVRQERPLHMRPEPMHPAMRERGYPSGPTNTKTFVEGRPGPIPGMRPLGGGFQPPASTKGNSMGLIMPIYTVGIIAFFAYTILKIVFKKNPQDQTTTAPTPTLQRRKSSTITSNKQQQDVIKRPDNGPSSKLVKVATTKSEERQQNTIMGNDFSSDVGITHEKSCGGDSVVGARDLLDIEELKRKLEETENAMTKIIARMSQIVPKTQDSKKTPEEYVKKLSKEDHDQQTVKILGMELTSTCEGGKKWDPANRLIPPNKSQAEETIETVTPQAIYLEGTLPSESQILVSDAEQHVEEEPNEGEDEGPAIILSSKMTLSLISLDNDHGKKSQSSPEKTKGSVTELVESIGSGDNL